MLNYCAYCVCVRYMCVHMFSPLHLVKKLILMTMV